MTIDINKINGQILDLNSVASYVTSSAITSALTYTPLNPSQNLNDVSNKATALSNIGGASSTQQAIHFVGDAGEPAFQNGWRNYGDTWGHVGFFKDNFGFVHLVGLATGGTVNGDPLLTTGNIFTLPEDCRPSTDFLLPTVSNNDFGMITIKSSGEVQASVGSSNYFSLQSASFRYDDL